MYFWNTKINTVTWCTLCTIPAITNILTFFGICSIHKTQQFYKKCNFNDISVSCFLSLLFMFLFLMLRVYFCRSTEVAALRPLEPQPQWLNSAAHPAGACWSQPPARWHPPARAGCRYACPEGGRAQSQSRLPRSSPGSPPWPATTLKRAQEAGLGGGPGKAAPVLGWQALWAGGCCGVWSGARCSGGCFWGPVSPCGYRSGSWVWCWASGCGSCPPDADRTGRCCFRGSGSGCWQPRPPRPADERRGWAFQEGDPSYDLKILSWGPPPHLD